MLTMLATSFCGSAVALALVFSVAALPQATPPRADDLSPDERVIFDATNRERSARKLRVLRWDPLLARVAREHAALMARNAAISHQFPGEPGLGDRASRAGVRFRLIEENVGQASNAAELQDAWMLSAPHRENLLNPNIEVAGIGVVAGPGGQLFGVVDFAKLTPKISLDDQEKQVESLLVARGLRIVEPPGVRKTCALDRGMDLEGHAKYLLRYTTSDLDELPGELLAEVKRGSYQSAAVGACAPVSEGPFSTYRLAVLLF